MPLSQKELGRRLRAARAACRMSQDDVSRVLGLSRSAVTQIELGNRSVRSLELEQLSALYGRSAESFLTPDGSVPQVLDRVRELAPELEGEPGTLETLERLVSLDRELARLESLLGIDRISGTAASYAVPLPKTDWEAIQQGERGAEEERRRLDLGQSPLRDVADTLSTLGVRAHRISLPDDVSGFTVHDRAGFLIVASQKLPQIQRRFMYAHGFAHVLFDRAEPVWICRAEHRESLPEVRANGFSAAFLMPETGVRRLLAGLGKGMANRGTAEVVDVFADPEEPGAGVAPVRVERRGEAGDQEISLLDLAQLAGYFGVTRSLALHRLRNLRLVTAGQVEQLRARDEAGEGAQIEKALGLDGEVPPVEDELLRQRLLALGIEAYRRGAIGREALTELAATAGAADPMLQQLAIGRQAEPPEGSGARRNGTWTRRSVRRRRGRVARKGER